MVEYTDVLSLQYLKKQIFSGSIKGLSYKIKSVPAGDDLMLKLYIWQGPYAYDIAKSGDIKEFEFPYTEEGRIKAIDTINEEYNSNESIYQNTSLI